MNELFEKQEYDTRYCKYWHIRKRMLELPHYDNQDLQFYDYGEISCRKNGEAPLNCNQYSKVWGICFITAGTCHCRSDQKSFELKKQDIFILPPHTSFQFTVTGGSLLKARKVLILDSPSAHILFTKLSQSNILHTLFPEEIEKLFDRMVELLMVRSRMQIRDLSIAIYSLLAELNRQLPDQESILTIKDVCAELECEPWKDYSISYLAKKCGLSARTFQRRFKAWTNMSFLTYLTKCKLTLCCQLLQNNRYSLKEIIKICNFHSEPHFYKLFKEFTGVPPGTYRNKLREDNCLKIGRGDLEVPVQPPEKLTGKREAILRYISSNRTISHTLLAESLELHRSAVQKNIQWLKKHGYLVRQGSPRSGFWSLTQKCIFPESESQKSKFEKNQWTFQKNIKKQEI